LEKVYRKKTKIKIPIETNGNKYEEKRINKSYIIPTNERGTQTQKKR
jgi:hypothetical protein